MDLGSGKSDGTVVLGFTAGTRRALTLLLGSADALVLLEFLINKNQTNWEEISC